MRREQEIHDLIEQIDRLHIRQSTLISRLARLKEVEQEERLVPNRRSRIHVARGAFAIGDRVRVRNPGRNQPSRGKITKMSENRITMESRSGIKIWRAPSNFILEEEES
jgi:hypothetical protein